jgi:UDPglucose 6-dehydrogenase
MIKIGVIGRGVVGGAVYDALKFLGHEVSFYDPKYEGSSIKDVLNTDCVFVCVPTDSLADGSCDISIVEKTVRELNTREYAGLVAIKSTVTPGTCEKLATDCSPWLRICSVPEFLRAKSALSDFMYNHDLLVIGSHRKADFELIKKIHGNLPAHVSCVSPTEAEVIKYFNNVNHSVQIMFATIFYDVCNKLGADYESVYEAITQRDCFTPAYLKCNENIKGFGGHCLPKDTKAWAHLMKQVGLEYKMIESVLSDNEKVNNG